LCCRPFFAHYFSVYPETMGVPLEEMDAVFGEGMSFVPYAFHTCNSFFFSDELQEYYENEESERASLVGSARSRSRSIRSHPTSPSRKPPTPQSGWLGRIMGRRADYEPIVDHE